MPSDKKSYEIEYSEFIELDEAEQQRIVDEFNADWREPGGTMIKGHPRHPRYNPDRKPRPKAWKQSDYQKAIAEAVSPDEFTKLIVKLVEGAGKKGATHKQVLDTVTFIADRLLGRPKQQVDVGVSTPEQWQIAVQERLSAQLLLPGEDLDEEEIVEADFQRVGASDSLSSEGDAGEEGRGADAQPSTG